MPSVAAGLVYLAVGGMAGALAALLAAVVAWFGLLAWFFRMHFAASALLLGTCWLLRWLLRAAVITLVA